MRTEIVTYATEQLGCTAENVFDKYPDYTVLRHPLSGKWAAIVMRIPARNIGVGGDELIDVMNVKLDPLLIMTLKNEPGYAPAWHMSKQYWLTVRLDGSVPFDRASALLDMSFSLVGPKQRKSKSKK